MTRKVTFLQRVPVERLLFLSCCLAILAYTWLPFEFTFSLVELRQRAAEPSDSTVVDFLLGWSLHLGAFFGLGFLIVLAHGDMVRKLGARRYIACVIIFCLILEIGKFFQPARHPQAFELFVNIVGLLSGTWCFFTAPFGRFWRIVLRKCRRVRSAFLNCVWMLAVISLWWAAGLRPVFGSVAIRFDAKHPFIIGNEIDGSRPWLGQIGLVRIYGRALAASNVQHLFGLVARNLSENLSSESLPFLLGYEFRDPPSATVIPLGVLAEPGLSLDVPPDVDWSADGVGLRLSRPATLITRQPAEPLASEINKSGAFSIEAWLCPLTVTQTGPARIVGVSGGISDRNFTLAQDGSRLSFRVRNGVNGQNGNRYALSGGHLGLGWQHLVAVYDHGVSVLYQNGRLTGPSIDLRQTPVYLFLGTTIGGVVIYGLLLVVTVAAPLSVLLSSAFGPVLVHSMAVVFAFAIGVMPYFLSCVVVGGPCRLPYCGCLAAVITLAYPIVCSYGRAVNTVGVLK